jgi:hypothetical protein
MFVGDETDWMYANGFKDENANWNIDFLDTIVEWDVAGRWYSDE